MTSPLERAARALALRNDGHEARWDAWEGDARAVLMAVREPSQPMLMAGRKQTFADMAGAHCGPSAENTYQAMIDTALDET